MADAVTPLFAPLRNVGHTFHTAAASYLEHGGEGRYLQPIVDYFGQKPLPDITPFDVRQMALQLYPEATNSTRNRCALTPARAVLSHGYDRGWCPLMRIRRFKPDPVRRKSPASPAWLQICVRQCDLDGLPHLAALVIFMSQTGARISEAIRLQWSEVDFLARRVILLKTKTGRNSPRFLTDVMMTRLQQLGATATPADRVFRYTSRHSVNERLRAVCARAGIAYKSPHLCGRHSFATNAMAMGADIKTAMDAGDWKSSSIFIEIYVHTANAGRLVADRFNSLEFGGDI